MGYVAREDVLNTMNYTSGVYAIHSAVNGRKYIGSSANISKRWRAHRLTLRQGTHHSQHLQRAWTKYGEDAFEFVILEECVVEQLIEREQYWFNQFPNKYNCAPVAGSSLGTKHTLAARANMSASKIGNTNNLGNVASPETRAKMSVVRKGKPLSVEHRDKIGATHRGVPKPSLLGNQHLMGHVHTEETKEKISEAMVGRVSSKEHKAKISDANRRRKHSPETRAKMSASAKARAARKREEKFANA